MGNASAKIEVEEEEEDSRGEGSSSYTEAEPMAHSPPTTPTRLRHLHPFLSFTPQVPLVRGARPGELIHVRNHTRMHNTIDCRDTFSEKLNPVIITWSFGGKQVAVTGSWDNWDKRQPLHRSGKDFVIMKMLPSGVFRYRFVVDEQLRYAPDLPWESDDSGAPYNILDVQDDVPEAPESLSEFETPSSPVTSYNNDVLDDNDFSKQPPDIPPQLQLTLLNNQSSAVDTQQSLPRPRHAVLNHLYIQSNPGQPVALGSTHRFLQKYVTVVLYKPSRR